MPNHEDWTPVKSPIGSDTRILPGLYVFRVVRGKHTDEHHVRVHGKGRLLPAVESVERLYGGKVTHMKAVETETPPADFSVPSVTLSADEYDFLVELATIGTSYEATREIRIANNQRLFQIVSNARRTN